MFNNGLFTEAEGMFTRKDLMKLLAPLIVEQILAVLVGMVDVMMVAAVGEAAVSGGIPGRFHQCSDYSDSGGACHWGSSGVSSVSGKKAIGKCLPGSGSAGWCYNRTVSGRDHAALIGNRHYLGLCLEKWKQQL